MWLPAGGGGGLQVAAVSHPFLCNHHTKKKSAAYFRVKADASLSFLRLRVSVLASTALQQTHRRIADMPPKGTNKQQSEEDLLLQDFSRNLSAKSTALFYGNALIVSAIPICE